jgi:hypothetical protein
MYGVKKKTKIENWMKYWKLYLAAILCFAMASGCNSEEEGCLDIQATNFDVSADVACSSCCTYPTLTLRINHVYDTTSNNFLLNKTYWDAIDSPYLVSAIQYYISDVQLVRADGSSVGVTDELEVTLADNSILSIEDNFSLLKKSIGSYSSAKIGSIHANGSFSKIRFNVGINPTANHAMISKMPDGHALAKQSESMHIDITQGYIFNKMQIVKGTTAQDTITYEISGDNNLVGVELDYPINISTGFDITLTIYLDYKKLFDGIDFKNDDDNTIQTKIVNNTSSAFSIK